MDLMGVICAMATGMLAAMAIWMLRRYGHEPRHGGPDTGGFANTVKRSVRDVFSNDSQTLRRCPFCGGKALIVTAVGESWVLCSKCKATTSMHTSERFAIAAWNRRADS